jgi:hypothetical protein
MNNAEIVEVARLVLAVDQSPDNETLAQRLDHRLDRFDIRGIKGALLMMATKILAGEPYMVCTDSPANAKQYRSFADYLGATVTEVDQGATIAADVPRPLINLRFDPPRRH